MHKSFRVIKLVFSLTGQLGLHLELLLSHTGELCFEEKAPLLYFGHQHWKHALQPQSKQHDRKVKAVGNCGSFWRAEHHLKKHASKSASPPETAQQHSTIHHTPPRTAFQLPGASCWLQHTEHEEDSEHREQQHGHYHRATSRAGAAPVLELFSWSQRGYA